jgi:hypothetical protein
MGMIKKNAAIIFHTSADSLRNEIVKSTCTGLEQYPYVNENVVREILNISFDINVDSQTDAHALVNLEERNGIVKGESKKLYNIVFNWRKLLLSSCKTALALSEATSLEPWQVLLVAFIINNEIGKLQGLTMLNLTEDQAFVLWSIWKSVDDNYITKTEKVLEYNNSQRIEHGQKAMALDDFTAILESLKELCSIRINSEEIELIEMVRES